MKQLLWVKYKRARDASYVTLFSLIMARGMSARAKAEKEWEAHQTAVRKRVAAWTIYEAAAAREGTE